MSTSFDPSKTNLNPPRQRERARRVYDERLIVKVESNQRDPDGTEWVVGSMVTNPDAHVRVRLSTVEERLSDNPERFNENTLRNQYHGEKRRDTLAEKAKEQIQYLSFDGARPLEVGEGGVPQFRAHWAQTVATSPEAEVRHGLASINLYEPPEGQPGKASAYVELLQSATLVDRANVREAVESLLHNADEEGRPRNAHAIMRVFYEGEEKATARLFPAKQQVMVKHPVYGDEKPVNKAVSGAESFEALMRGDTTGIQATDVNNDLARAVIAGLLDADEAPPRNLADRGAVENFFNGAKDNAFHVELVGVERISFGVDSAKSYLKDRANPKFAGYVGRSEGGGTERRYAETVVATMRHKDGAPFAVFASPDKHLVNFAELGQFDDNNPLSAYLPEDAAAVRARNAKVEGAEPGM